MKKKIIVVIPVYSETSGGIKRMLRLAEQLLIRGYDIGIHIQRVSKRLSLPVGLTYGTNVYSEFPSCDTVITYSDDPYIEEYQKILPAVNLLVYMLSFGMCLEREVAVVRSGAKILCSTQKVVDEIEACLCRGVYKIGFSLDEHRNCYFNEGRARKYISIMYHPAPKKNFALTRMVCDGLGLPVIVFGQRPAGLTITVPKNTQSIYYNAGYNTIRSILNRSRLFINMSESEGLNLTPFEAALCGTPSILCDGSDEIHDIENFVECNVDAAIKKSKRILKRRVCSKSISENAYEVSKAHTWDTVINKLKGFL